MPTDTQTKSTALYFRDARSDKVYQASIQSKGAGFVVDFAFGRRNSTLQTGTKTAKPVDYQAALKVYDKLVREKMAKGYTPGEDGTPYQGTQREAAATGVFPQLLNPIDEDQAEQLIADDDWWMQEKFDGKRILIRKDGDQVIGINRKGLVVALPQPIVEQAKILVGQRWLMDGEAIGDAYVAFDMLEDGNTDLRQKTYSYRLDTLIAIVLRGDDPQAIRLPHTAVDIVQKRVMLDDLRRMKAEGAVFKRSSAPYTPGRPASGGDQLKLKFTATASCIVAKANGTKRSVALVLLDGGKRVAVGNVTIPPNMPMPKAGSVIETRYLYAYKGGSLYQPVCLGQRDDIDPAACTIGQLKYKAADEDEEAESGPGGKRT